MTDTEPKLHAFVSDEGLSGICETCGEGLQSPQHRLPANELAKWECPGCGAVAGEHADHCTAKCKRCNGRGQHDWSGRSICSACAGIGMGPKALPATTLPSGNNQPHASDNHAPCDRSVTHCPHGVYLPHDHCLVCDPDAISDEIRFFLTPAGRGSEGAACHLCHGLGHTCHELCPACDGSAAVRRAGELGLDPCPCSATCSACNGSGRAPLTPRS